MSWNVTTVVRSKILNVICTNKKRSFLVGKALLKTYGFRSLHYKGGSGGFPLPYKDSEKHNSKILLDVYASWLNDLQHQPRIGSIPEYLSRENAAAFVPAFVSVSFHTHNFTRLPTSRQPCRYEDGLALLAEINSLPSSQPFIFECYPLMLQTL
jgi:hypothetical protein